MYGGTEIRLIRRNVDKTSAGTASLDHVWFTPCHDARLRSGASNPLAQG
jgi:hypothetical protein